MEELKVVGLYNYGDVKCLLFNNTNNFCGLMCNLLRDLGFPEDEVLESDRDYDPKFGEYMFFRKDELKFHIFITKERIYLVLDSEDSDMIIDKIEKKVDKFLSS